jgi:hypothetical protein
LTIDVTVYDQVARLPQPCKFEKHFWKERTSYKHIEDSLVVVRSKWSICSNLEEHRIAIHCGIERIQQNDGRRFQHILQE